MAKTRRQLALEAAGLKPAAPVAPPAPPAAAPKPPAPPPAPAAARPSSLAAPFTAPSAVDLEALRLAVIAKADQLGWDGKPVLEASIPILQRELRQFPELSADTIRQILRVEAGARAAARSVPALRPGARRAGKWEIVQAASRLGFAVSRREKGLAALSHAQCQAIRDSEFHLDDGADPAEVSDDEINAALAERPSYPHSRWTGDDPEARVLARTVDSLAPAESLRVVDPAARRAAIWQAAIEFGMGDGSQALTDIGPVERADIERFEEKLRPTLGGVSVEEINKALETPLTPPAPRPVVRPAAVRRPVADDDDAVEISADARRIAGLEADLADAQRNVRRLQDSATVVATVRIMDRWFGRRPTNEDAVVDALNAAARGELPLDGRRWPKWRRRIGIVLMVIGGATVVKVFLTYLGWYSLAHLLGG